MNDSVFLTGKVFKQGMARLEAAFRHQPLTQACLEVYFEKLKDLNDTVFAQAVENAIDSEDFFPSIAKLLKLSGNEAVIEIPIQQRSLKDLIS